MRDEASYVCDSCGQEIVVPLDLSAKARRRNMSRIAPSAAIRTSCMSKSMTMGKRVWAESGAIGRPYNIDSN